MSHWNYRVMRVEYDSEVHYEIREVYYDDEGKPNGYFDKPAGVGVSTTDGDPINGLRRELDRMREALTKPTLTPEDCGG